MENKKAAGACCHKKSDKTSKTKIWFIYKKRVFLFCVPILGLFLALGALPGILHMRNDLTHIAVEQATDYIQGIRRHGKVMPDPVKDTGR